MIDPRAWRVGQLLMVCVGWVVLATVLMEVSFYLDLRRQASERQGIVAALIVTGANRRDAQASTQSDAYVISASGIGGVRLDMTLERKRGNTKVTQMREERRAPWWVWALLPVSRIMRPQCVTDSQPCVTWGLDRCSPGG
jgi:hypothetical protein